MTWAGAPTLYYGDEAGVCGWTDPDNRRTYPWGNEDMEMIAFHKEIIRIHRNYEMFKNGSLYYLHSEYQMIGYGRFLGDEAAFVMLQIGGEDREVEVNVWGLGLQDGDMMASMIETNRDGFSVKADFQRVENGKVKVKVRADGAVIWKNIKIC